MLRGEFRHVVGLAGQVADHPGVVHAVAGCGGLRVVEAVEDLDGVVRPHLQANAGRLNISSVRRVTWAALRESIWRELRSLTSPGFPRLFFAISGIKRAGGRDL